MPSTGHKKYVHIAAGCILGERGEVLICRRPPHKIYPGEWEFPGGKVEPGETTQQALERELHEELGITVRACRPLIRLRHVYPELSVDLDTWLVTAYTGTVQSTEHPEMAWVAPDELPKWSLLAADRPIVNALRLPDQCVVTPPQLPKEAFRAAVDRLPPRALLRLRLPALSDDAYHRMAAGLAQALGGRSGVSMLLDRDPAQVPPLAGGFHARSDTLATLERRPLPPRYWFSASCHDEGELRQAQRCNADFVLLGPVLATPSHPGAAPLGWAEFARLAALANMPVYAIGGVGPDDLPTAWEHGAQGVAGISAYRDRASR